MDNRPADERFVKVVLEKPWVYGKPKGSLQVRFGTSPATKNLNYDARRPSSGPVYWPGKPIFYPADGPAVAGDAERESWIMPLLAAKQVFGDWDAPLEEAQDGIPGHTLATERERVAQVWFGYKICNGDGTMHPPVVRIGLPAVPFVAIYPLDSRNRVLKEGGKEVCIRPWDIFDFGVSLDALPDEPETINSAIGELSSEEVTLLKALLKDRGLLDVLRAVVGENGKEKAKVGAR